MVVVMVMIRWRWRNVRSVVVMATDRNHNWDRCVAMCSYNHNDPLR